MKRQAGRDSTWLDFRSLLTTRVLPPILSPTTSPQSEHTTPQTKHTCPETNTQLWNLKTFKIKNDLPGHTDEVYCVDFVADKVVSGGRDKTVKM